MDQDEGAARRGCGGTQHDDHGDHESMEGRRRGSRECDHELECQYYVDDVHVKVEVGHGILRSNQH